MRRPCCDDDALAQSLRDMAPSEFEAWKARLERKLEWLDFVGGVAAFIAAGSVLALLGATWINAFHR